MNIPIIKILEKNFNYDNNRLYLKVEYRFNIQFSKKTMTDYIEQEYNQYTEFINEKIGHLNNHLFMTRNLQKINNHVQTEKIEKYIGEFKNAIKNFNDKNIDFSFLIDSIFFDNDLTNLKNLIDEIKQNDNYDQNTLNNIQSFINSHINQINENFSKKEVKKEKEIPSYDTIVINHELNQIATNDEIISFLKEQHGILSKNYKNKKLLKEEKDQLPDEIF